jgi:SAM-dependent methyltransferase
VSTERWLDFWRAHGRQAAGDDPQTQVLRTFNKQPIAEARWQDTLIYLDRLFPIGPVDDILDLCCGNGLFSAHFAPRARTVTAVDISPDLLGNLARRSLPNVTTLCSDVREAHFVEGTFSRILLYAGIQYLSEGEVVLLFQNMQRWLRPDGLLFIGDVPDRARLWSFYNTPERRSRYFDNCISDQDVVGTWFDSLWLQYLAERTGFRKADVILQPSQQIYAHFRFDMKVQR